MVLCAEVVPKESNELDIALSCAPEELEELEELKETLSGKWDKGNKVE